MDQESIIALDPAPHAPHRSGVEDDRPDPINGRMPPVGKEAKLAAALRANLARRKTALRQARRASPSSKSEDQEN